ncbi:MAG: hypothetical protein F6K55_39340 [Moorea sp. SIO4A3]|nr:hypothetical protein [Moorena sp. SIO4A3]
MPAPLWQWFIGVVPCQWRGLCFTTAVRWFPTRDYRDVLNQAARCLPKDVKIVLLAANRVCP